MNAKEKILLVQLLLEDVRGNWGWEKDGGICSRAVEARDLCGELARELADKRFSILADCCNEYISDYFDDGDGRYFRDVFPYGYEDMDSLHGLEHTYMDKSDEFKLIAEEYITYPNFRFDDWENKFKD